MTSPGFASEPGLPPARGALVRLLGLRPDGPGTSNRAEKKGSMIKKPSPAKVTGDLRVRAEQVLAAGGTVLQPILADDVRELVHELRVHQIELETQNEELRRAQEAITESRNRYVDLYDLAPVGYVTLDPQGRIVELNLKGAKLLGAPRNSLIQRPFILLVVPEDRQTFHGYLWQLSVSADHQSCELEFNLQQSPATALSLESLALVETGGKFSSITWPSLMLPGAARPRSTCAAVKKSSACSMKKPLWATNLWTKTASSGRSTRPGWTSWDIPGPR